MESTKKEILEKHCYTELVYGRINKKLNANFTTEESKKYIKKVLEETSKERYEKIGKNFYVTNIELKIRVTVNSNTYRIITVDKIKI